VKILDFGLAKLTQPQSGSDDNAITLTKGTEAGMVMGTVGYMAPEQVRGEAADYRADIFAFGAILYEMLAGKRAFQKPTSAETVTAILNEDPPGLSQITTNLPPALQRVVQRCLEKNPEQRFQSNAEDCAAMHRKTLAKLFKLAKVTGNPHMFRHTFAKRLLIKRVPLELVSVLLGHRKTDVTQRHYNKWVPERQKGIEDAVRTTWI
jgi:serine/threonine protein kinase